MVKIFTICLAFLFFLGYKGNGMESENERPNIVLIMADDLGYGGIGSYGEANIKTPNLDALTKGGIRFTDFHSNGSVCTPTRAALLTGNYQQRAGLEGVIYAYNESRQTGLDTAQITIAELLKNDGYRTAVMGKWHLGYQKKFNPVHHGFDEFWGYVSGNIDYHSKIDGIGIYDWWHNLEIVKEDGYVTDLITQHSIDFINQNQKSPFFLYVAYQPPHTPLQGRNDPAFRVPGKRIGHSPVKDEHRAYKEMVEIMDDGVGRIVKTLDKRGLLENTLIFFLSDNGPLPIGNDGGLNGKKGDLLEGGHRVPAVAYWKDHISPGESSETLISMDILPTFLSISRSQISKSLTFDGEDFSQVLLGKSSLDTRSLFWRFRKEKAVRRNQWKLLVTESDTLLYNLKTDLKETKDRSKIHQNVVKNLLKELDAWEQTMGNEKSMKTL